MNFYITQTITIQKLSIGTINNSSVVQIGTTGSIKPLTHLYNTGNFEEAAPELPHKKAGVNPSSPQAPSLVPLAPI